MIRGIPNISIHSIASPAYQNGKMSLPVDSSSFIYSHFEHVSGVVASNGTHGVSISKLKLLNVLIENINQAGRRTSSSGRMLPAPTMSERQMDALIEQFSKQIRQTKEASSTMPYIPSHGIGNGTLFNIVI
jgi:hypothetical protein